MLRSVKVSAFMATRPVVASPNMTVFEAAKLTMQNKISGLPVVDETGKLVGMLSELDCLRVLLDSVYNDQEYGAQRVSDVMTTEVDVCHPEDDIVDVAASMLNNRHRRRPVVEDGKLVGQLTCRQILRAVREFTGVHDPAEQP